MRASGSATLRRRYEPALGAAGHDDRVLHHLGLHQTQDLGAEVVGTVAPADSAAGHPRASEVHTLHARRVHPDLVEQAGVSQELDVPAGELEREVGDPARPGRGRPAPVAVVVRPERARDQLLQTAQRAVVGEDAHPPQRAQERLTDVRGRSRCAPPGRPARSRIEPRLEEIEQLPGEPRILDQRVGQRETTRQRPDLERVGGVRPQHRDLTPMESGTEHELVERVAHGVAGAHRENGLGQELAS